MYEEVIRDSIYFLNAKNISNITLNKHEWIVTDKLTLKFIEKIKSKQYKVAFIGQENVFSHGINVLRKILLDGDVVVIIGVKKILNLLRNTENCTVDIEHKIVNINNKYYKFRSFNYLNDTSEIIEYNMDSNEICYKPDYYYCKELASLIIKGYNRTGTFLNSPHISRYEDDGRIWDRGLVFPCQIFEYYNTHKDNYYNTLLKYILVLKKIYLLCHSNKNISELTENIIAHYSYSIVFSFITPNISETLRVIIGDEGLEQIYGLFIINSPIHNKKELTLQSLEKMQSFLSNILKQVENEINYSNIYSAQDIPSDDLGVMFFVTNMISDIRRCVINMLIENNDWFSSICTHRKKTKIY